jgi:hypothetical protein
MAAPEHNIAIIRRLVAAFEQADEVALRELVADRDKNDSWKPRTTKSSAP